MNRIVPLIVTAWFVVALVAGRLGALSLWPPPYPQIVLVGLVLVQMAAVAMSRRFRAWLMAVPVDALVGLHVSRFVGAYFLVLHAQGRLPWAFAVPGGWGDIAVATGALVLVLLRRIGRPAPRAVYTVWNVLGLVDILGVVTTAARNALADAASMQPLVELPLSLLPSFLVPLIIFTHFVLLVRVRSTDLISPHARRG
jgi:hypothetical protein